MKKLLLLLLSTLFVAVNSVGAQALSITTLPLAVNNYCPNSNLSVGFTITGSLTPGNIFNVQLSNATGSFAAPVIIGFLTGTSGGTIPATIPAGTATGTGYRVRVVSTLPNVNGTDNGTDISIGIQPATGTISGPGIVCAFTGGHVYSVAAAPGANAYTWSLPPGWTGTSTTNSITVTSSNSGGTITVVANGGCGASTSQSFLVNTITAPAQPSVITGGTPVCNGSTNTFSVSSVPGVTYAWTLPNTWSGTSTTNSISALVGPAAGTISVTASNTCGTSPASTLGVTVTPSITPFARITSSLSGTICGTIPVTYTAVVTNAGSSPIYQWKRNGQNVGTPSLTYTANYTSNGDIITFELTSSATCALPATVLSNQIVMSVTPGVDATAAPANVCRNGSLQLSATTVGNSTYSWTGPGYTSTQQSPSIQTIFNSGYYTVVATSNACITRDSILVTVNPLPALTITQNGGMLETTPGYASYTWTRNGVIIPGATTASYTPTQGGNYVAQAVSAAGCSGSSPLYVFRATGINNVTTGNGFIIYPSPAYSELHVVQDQLNTASAFIYNNLGQIVLTKNGLSRNQDYTLDMNTLPAGVYVITLRNPSNGDVLVNRTFVKQ